MGPQPDSLTTRLVELVRSRANEEPGLLTVHLRNHPEVDAQIAPVCDLVELVISLYSLPLLSLLDQEGHKGIFISDIVNALRPRSYYPVQENVFEQLYAYQEAQTEDNGDRGHEDRPEVSQVTMFDRFIGNSNFKQALDISQTMILTSSITHGFTAYSQRQNRYSPRHHGDMANNAFLKLCHMNVNVVTNSEYYWTLTGGVWFSVNLRQRVPPGRWDDLCAQLNLFDAMATVYSHHASEQNWWPIDPNRFDRLVTLAQRNVEDVLFDRAALLRHERGDASPAQRELDEFIARYLWREFQSIADLGYCG